MARHEARTTSRKLVKNVRVGGQWYGPAYPDAGDPPEGSVLNPAAFAEDPSSGSSAAPPMDVQVTVHDAEGVTREGTVKARHVDDTEAPSEPSKPSEAAGDEEPPPRAGPGSGRARWTEYAAAHGITVDDETTRDEIIDACAQAGVPTE